MASVNRGSLEAESLICVEYDSGGSDGFTLALAGRQSCETGWSRAVCAIRGCNNTISGVCIDCQRMLCGAHWVLCTHCHLEFCDGCLYRHLNEVADEMAGGDPGPQGGSGSDAQAVRVPPRPGRPPWVAHCVVCGDSPADSCRECHRMYCGQHSAMCLRCMNIWCVDHFEGHWCRPSRREGRGPQRRRSSARHQCW